MLELYYKCVKDEKLDKTWVHFYLKLENGNYVQVKPAFKEDYSKLRLIARKDEN